MSLFFPDRFSFVNLGTGFGVTVREFIGIFEETIGTKINKRVVGRRHGDTVGVCSSGAVAQKMLSWLPSLSLKDGITDALRWEAIKKDI